jgi:hypothetical protein
VSSSEDQGFESCHGHRKREMMEQNFVLSMDVGLRKIFLISVKVTVPYFTESNGPRKFPFLKSDWVPKSLDYIN